MTIKLLFSATSFIGIHLLVYSSSVFESKSALDGSSCFFEGVHGFTPPAFSAIPPRHQHYYYSRSYHPSRSIKTNIHSKNDPGRLLSFFSSSASGVARNGGTNESKSDGKEGTNEIEMEMDRVLPPEYFKSVYEITNNDAGNDKIPWDTGGGQPQPEIVRTFKEGKLKGRIIDAGCGMGENCIHLAQKGSHGGIEHILGFDLAPRAIEIAEGKVAQIELELEEKKRNDATTTTTTSSTNDTNNDDKFWTKPQFLVASCTEIADVYFHHHQNQMKIAASSGKHHDERNENATQDDNDEVDDMNGNPHHHQFDVMIDSGLLHCLSDEDATRYISQMTQLVKPVTGRAFVGCFSTANPDPWDNPRRLSEEYLRRLFSDENGWEVISVRDTWWSRPPERGSSQGSFSMALWMEAKRLA